jgi:hypothetical protein
MEDLRMKSNFVFPLILVLAVSTTAQAAESLASRNLMGGRLTMLVPTSFRLLTDAEKRAKYPGANAPASVLSSADTTVNIAFDHKPIAFKPEDISKLEQDVRAKLAAGALNSAGRKKLGGTDFVVFGTDTDAPDGTISNLMAFASVDDRLFVVSYNCLVSRDPACGDLGKKLIDSIVVNPKPAAH